MIRVAIAGTGVVAGACHLPALRAEADRVAVVAAMDVDTDRVRAFCAEHEIPVAYTDLDRMLAEMRPDLVHICTPPHAHAEQIAACLAAGAWVLCEKPACLSLAEYDTITAAERQAAGGTESPASGRPGGPYAAVVCQHRFGSGARHLRGLIETGELGRPLVAQCVTAWYRDHEYFDSPWRGRWDTEGGGTTATLGVHQMDLMLSLLGDWEEVRAMAGRLDRRVEYEDVSMAMVRFASGAMASVVNSVLSPRQESYLRFDFTNASVELRHLYGYRNANWTYTPAPHIAWDVAGRARVAAWRSPVVDIESSHAAQLGPLLDAYERGERPAGSGDDGRRVLEFVAALYKSAFTGRPVRRAEILPDDPSYHRPHGDAAGWAPTLPSWERW
jgi:predicted dehydrogenase